MSILLSTIASNIGNTNNVISNQTLIDWVVKTITILVPLIGIFVTVKTSFSVKKMERFKIELANEAATISDMRKRKLEVYEDIFRYVESINENSKETEMFIAAITDYNYQTKYGFSRTTNKEMGHDWSELLKVKKKYPMYIEGDLQQKIDILCNVVNEVNVIYLANEMLDKKANEDEMKNIITKCRAIQSYCIGITEELKMVFSISLGNQKRKKEGN